MQSLTSIIATMKQLILSVAVIAALTLTGAAKTYNLPEEETLATIEIPDSWETDQTDDGIETTSKDGGVYFYAEVTDADNVAEAMEEGVKYLKEKGVTVNDSSMKKQQGKLKDMDVVDISWDGKDKDGEAKVSLMVVSITNDKGVLFVYWASPEGEKANQADLEKIVQSLKKA